MFTAKEINNVKKALGQAEEWWAKGKALNPKSTMGSAARTKMQALIEKMEASRASPRPVSDGMVDKIESLISSAFDKLEGRAATPPAGAAPPPPPAPTALEQALTTVLTKMNHQEPPPPQHPLPPTGPAPGKMEVSIEDYTNLKAEKLAAEKLVTARQEDKVEIKEERDAGRTETKELISHLVDMAKGALSAQHKMGMALTPSSEGSRPRLLRPPSSQGSEFYEEHYEEHAPAPAPALLQAPPPMPALLPPGPPGGGAHTFLVQAIKEFLQITETQPKVALMEAATQMGMPTAGPLPALADALIAALGINL